MKLNFLKRITTGRILIVLYIVVCIVEGYNVFPIRELTSESIKRYNAISESALQKLDVIAKIRLNLDQIQSAKFKHILHVDMEAMKQEILEINSTVYSNDSLFSELQKRMTTPEEEMYFDDVLEKRRENMESRKQLLRISMSGDKEKAIEYMETSNDKALLDYDNALTALEEQIVLQAKNLTSETNNYIIRMRRAVDIVLFLSVLLVVITGLMVFAVNRKLNRQNRALIAQEKKYHDMVDNTDEMMATINTKGEVLWANRAWKENTLYTDDDFKNGLSTYNILDDSTKEIFSKRLLKVLRGERLDNAEGVLISKSGEKVFIYGKSIPVESKGKITGMQSFLRNITARKKAEELARQSAVNYQRVVENINDGICIDDIEGRVIFANRQFCVMHDVDENRIPGLTLEEYVAAEYHDELRDRHNRRIAGEKVPEEFTYEGIDKNGIRKLYEVRVTPIMENGKVIGTQSINRDITESKAAADALQKNYSELKKINEELDRFVYSTSHDLRAPLLAVQGALELMEQPGISREELAEYNSTIRKIISQMDDTIKEILDYSRNARINIIPEHLDIKKMIENARSQIMQPRGSRTILYSASVEEPVPFYSDKMRLTTIINNLMVNAFKYTREDEKNPFVKVSFHSGEKEGVLTVEDNGEGVPPEFIEKIFDMFFRVSEKSEGSGLGLYICRETVEKLNGTIVVASVVEKGSIFTVRIPNLNSTI